MKEEFEAELKEWIKSNLLIEVEKADRFDGSNNDVYVSLRFAGDQFAFCTERIDIPEKS